MSDRMGDDSASRAQRVNELPRGGMLVDTPAGNIQVGAPPETIKDTITSEDSVPQTFVLPRELFNWFKGINVGDMEFPIYFNFFLRKQRVRVICTAEQAERIRTAICESVFGPPELDISQDAFPAGDDLYIPDITGELAFFRGNITLEDLLELVVFDENGCATVDGVHIHHIGQHFVFSWDGVEQVSVPDAVDYTDRSVIGRRSPEPFAPPRFGVTCLGPSHGFDPEDNTSGFIIWLNHAGIMVDPPVNSTEWLKRSNVSPKFIDSVILTHTHADHDAGTFQKILEESRITVYTTHTIMESFLRKYAALSGESVSFLETFFTFHPVYMGRPFYLHGGEFQIYYALHSIPTMAFRLNFQGRTFVYSSDHQADPEVHRELLARGIIDSRRYDQLRSFAWESDVIYHEAGFPPLHTPVEYLAGLSEDIRRRMVLFHIAAKDMPSDGRLRRATFGIENTLFFDTEASPYEDAYRVLDVLKHLDFAEELTVAQIQEFLSSAEWKFYAKGDRIIERGSRGTHFYVMISGNAVVMAENLVRGKQLGAYDYFGEVALLTSSTRTADIVAESDVQVITLEKPRFLNLIAGTEFESTLRRLIANRSEETWNLLVESPYFTILTDYQRMWLESVLETESVSGPATLIEKGKHITDIFLIRSGTAYVSWNGKVSETLGRGDMIGDLHLIHRNDPAPYSVTVEGTVDVFRVRRERLRTFLQRNPGVAVRMPRPVVCP